MQHECAVETNLKFSLKIEKESLLKQLWKYNFQHCYMILTNLKNITIFEQSKGAVSALRGPKIHNS